MATCGKVRYPSRKSAKKGLKRIQRETDIPVKTIYYCDDCSSYHHTSQSRSLNRAINKKIKSNNERNKSKR